MQDEIVWIGEGLVQVSLRIRKAGLRLGREVGEILPVVAPGIENKLRTTDSGVD